MPNQYGLVERIDCKCENPSCTTIVSRTPYQIRAGKKRFCSQRCYGLNKSLWFSEETKLWVMANLHISFPAMAEHFNVSSNAFRKYLDEMRSEGWAVPFRPGNRTKIRKARNYPLSEKDQEHAEWIIENIGKKSHRQIAERLGISEHSIQNRFNKYRSKGYAIPLGKENWQLAKGIIVKRAKIIDMNLQGTKYDLRSMRKGKPSREHLNNKPPVEFARFKKEDKPIPTRKIVDGPIKIFFKDKNKTKFTARDQEHYERIIRTYSPQFGEHYVTGLDISDVA
jgi:transposase/endogenous inhibitor of DNA gyrase (YacG/DUF329 family)